MFINTALKLNRSECDAGEDSRCNCNNLQTSIQHLCLLSGPKAAVPVPQLLCRSGE